MARGPVLLPLAKRGRGVDSCRPRGGCRVAGALPVALDARVPVKARMLLRAAPLLPAVLDTETPLLALVLLRAALLHPAVLEKEALLVARGLLR